jgi:hypothetical protein
MKSALLTRNCNDFLKLHQLNSNHFGILAVYQDSDPLKNMSYQGIVQAIGNLKAVEMDLTGQRTIVIVNPTFCRGPLVVFGTEKSSSP